MQVESVLASGASAFSIPDRALGYVLDSESRYTNVLRSGRVAVFARDFLDSSATAFFRDGPGLEFYPVEFPDVRVAKAGPFCGLPIAILSREYSSVELPFSKCDLLDQTRDVRSVVLRPVGRGRVSRCDLPCDSVCGPSNDFVYEAEPAVSVHEKAVSYFSCETVEGDCGSWFYDDHGLLASVMATCRLTVNDKSFVRLPFNARVTLALSPRKLALVYGQVSDGAVKMQHDVLLLRGRRSPGGLMVSRQRTVTRMAVPRQQPRVQAPKRRVRKAARSSVLARVQVSSGPLKMSMPAAFHRMILSPHERRTGVRYPDDSLLPTALTHLTQGNVFAVPAGGSNFITAIRWKAVIEDIPGNVIGPMTLSTGSLVYLEPILLPQTIPTTSVNGFYSKWTNYGDNQLTWSALSNTDRTLAAGISIKPAGLPPSTFVYSGNLYWIQAQMEEAQDVFNNLTVTGEPYARQLVNAGKAFTVTADELNKARSGINLSILPAGSNGYAFSDTNSQAAAIAGAFPYSLISASYPAANPGTLAANGVVIVVGYGLDPGEKFFFQHSHHVEYTPRVSASGIIATKVQPPSSKNRDSISSGIAHLAEQIFGSTKLKDILDAIIPKTPFQQGAEFIRDRYQSGGRPQLAPGPVRPLLKDIEEDAEQDIEEID